MKSPVLKSPSSPWYLSILRLSLFDFKYRRSTTRRLSADAPTRENSVVIDLLKAAPPSQEKTPWFVWGTGKLKISTEIMAEDLVLKRRSSFQLWINNQPVKDQGVEPWMKCLDLLACIVCGTLLLVSVCTMKLLCISSI